MATDFSRNVLRVAIAQMCQNLGWNSVQSTAMEILTDVLERYMCEIGRFSCRYAEQFGRTDANLDDLGLAIQEMGINLNEVEDYIKHVDPVPFAIDVPAFPVHRQNQLNFPKPNSRELREREEHIPPHLPPLNPGWNEEVYTPRTPSITLATSGPPQGSPKQGAPLVLPQGGSAEKRPFSSPVDGVSPVKKARILPDDVLHSHYEMKGVTMTTSGFLSPIKGQGKMPDARAPPKMPLYPVPPPTETESGGSEVRAPVDAGGDAGSRQKVALVSGIVPSPKVKKNLTSFSKHAKGTKSPRSPARSKSPGRSKSPKRGPDDASRDEGSKLKELLITGDSVLDLTKRPGEGGARGDEYGEIASSPEHELVIADDEDPEVKQRRLTSYCDTIDLVVRASREAILKEEDEDRHHGKGAEALLRERQMIERLEKEKMEWFREQEQQIKQDFEVALQAKKQLEMERQQREHAQIAEKEREAHIDDTINDVIANATAEVAQIEDEESRRQKDVYEFDDDDFGAVARPSVALHPKPNEKEPVKETVKETVKDTVKDVASEKVKDVTKDSVSASKDPKKSKSKKLKIKISSEAGVVKEPGWSEDVVDIKEKLKQKLQMRGPSPEPPGGHVEDIPTFAISARPTVIKTSPGGTSSPSRVPAVSSPSVKTETAAPSGGDSGKDFFIAPIRIEKTTLTIKKEKGDRDRGREGREGHEHKKSKKKNKDKAKKHEKSKERREKEHNASREERRKEKKRKKEERKSGKKAHQEEGKSLMIPKLTFKFGSGDAASSISVCRSDTPKVAPPAEPVKLVIRPPVAPPEVEPDIKPITPVASPPPSPKSPIPVAPSPQPSPPPQLPPSPIRERSPSPPPPRRSPTPTPVFTPSPARSATPTFIPSLPEDSPSPTHSPTRSPEHIILRSPSRSISPEPLSHSPIPTPSPSPPPRSPTPPPPATPSPPPRSRSPSPSPPPKQTSPVHSPPRHASPPPPSDSPKPILLSRPTLAARKAIPPSQRKKQAKGKRTPSATHIPPSSPPPPLPPTSAALAFQRGVISETQGTIRDEHGDIIWICPACKLPDDGSPMIGCEDCPDWYHWVCVGIKVEPAATEDWFCPRCRLKQKKKKQRRKKSK